MSFNFTTKRIIGSISPNISGKQQKMSEKEMFGSKSLKCLVCQKMVGEFEHKISKVDKKKKISTGNFRIKSDGGKSETIVIKKLHNQLKSVCR